MFYFSLFIYNKSIIEVTQVKEEGCIHIRRDKEEGKLTTNEEGDEEEEEEEEPAERLGGG